MPTPVSDPMLPPVDTPASLHSALGRLRRYLREKASVSLWVNRISGAHDGAVPSLPRKIFHERQRPMGSRHVARRERVPEYEQPIHGALGCTHASVAAH